jgi:hypothetical protein
MARYREAITQGLALARQRAIRLNVDLFEQFATVHAAGWRPHRGRLNLAARLARLVESYDLTFNRPSTPEPQEEDL